MMSKNKV